MFLANGRLKTMLNICQIKSLKYNTVKIIESEQEVIKKNRNRPALKRGLKNIIGKPVNAHSFSS